jgi:hypothetical protein
MSDGSVPWEMYCVRVSYFVRILFLAKRSPATKNEMLGAGG